MLDYGNSQSMMDRPMGPKRPRPVLKFTPDGNPSGGPAAPRPADPAGAAPGFGRDPFHDALANPGSRGDGSPFLPSTGSLTGGGPASRGEGSPFLAGGGAPTATPMFPTDTFSGDGPRSRGEGMSPSGYTGGMGGGVTGGYQSPYASMTSFGPGNDWRGSTIAPSESGALQGMGGAVGQARGAYTGSGMPAWRGVGAGSYTPGADTTGVRSGYVNALNQLATAPDRGQLASGYMSLLNQQNDEAGARDIRTIGQAASKFGRIGSGITTTNLGDLGERQAISRDRAGKELSLDAAGQTMADRLATVGAFGSGFSTLGGADRADAGVQQSLRNEARGERDAGNSYAQQLWNNNRTRYGDLLTEQGAQRAYESGLRDELRGERGYQGQMETQAYNRRIGETALADQLTGNAFQRAMQMLNAGYGTGGNLQDVLMQIAGQQGASAAGGGSNWATVLASLIGNG